jgi:hypothetical protein
VLAVAAARARRREDGVARLVGEIFAGRGRRELPEPVVATLAALEQARRGVDVVA